MEFSKEEIRKLLIVAFIAAIVFSFNEWGIEKFNLLFGLKNLLISLIFCIIVYTTHITFQKLTAAHYEYRIQFEILSMKKKIKEIRRVISLPLGPIVTLLTTLISNGNFMFLTLTSYTHITKKEFRVGRQWANLKEFENAQIALSGPLSQLALVAIFKFLLPISQVFSKGMFIASTIAIFNMVPIPKADGIKIFFGSIPLYITSVLFIIFFIVLIFHISIIQTILLSLIFSIVIGTLYLYKTVKT